MKIAFYVLNTFLIIDFIQLFNKGTVEGKRITPEKLSNGDDNKILITIKSLYYNCH